MAASLRLMAIATSVSLLMAVSRQPGDGRADIRITVDGVRDIVQERLSEGDPCTFVADDTTWIVTLMDVDLQDNRNRAAVRIERKAPNVAPAACTTATNTQA
jgi:hypothetical protein